MKRMHVKLSVEKLSVEDLDASVRFCSGLFGTEPTVLKPDYAKWMPEDPRVNGAIAARGRQAGFDHLGIQADRRDELTEVYGRLTAAARPALEQGNTTCCYARSGKSRITNPQGVARQAFFTRGESTAYGDDVGRLSETDAAVTADRGRSTNTVASTPQCNSASKL